MSVEAVVAFALAVLIYVTVAQKTTHWLISAPVFFTAVGAVARLAIGSSTTQAHAVQSLAEVTLALVLFHDAALVRPRAIEGDVRFTSRLLMIGLPLTIALGFTVARLMYPQADVWLILLLAAAITPTDAALGAATVTNPAVPARVRRVLNVESGLNDGLTTPVVLFALAASAQVNSSASTEALRALGSLAIGVLVGLAVGVGAAYVLNRAVAAGLAQASLVPVAIIVLPLLAYYGAELAHGNGFVAAFVSGTAFGAAFKAQLPEKIDPLTAHPLQLTEWVSDLLTYAVWAVFGALVAYRAADFFNWKSVAFALIALTLLRMLPVAVSLLGSGFKWPTTVFIGWFGPRGLATVIFALISTDELGLTDTNRFAVAGMIMTVLLSVVLHGATSGPGAATYGRWAKEHNPSLETVEIGP
jgi:sodium/hydrogen antiporter